MDSAVIVLWMPPHISIPPGGSSSLVILMPHKEKNEETPTHQFLNGRILDELAAVAGIARERDLHPWTTHNYWKSFEFQSPPPNV